MTETCASPGVPPIPPNETHFHSFSKNCLEAYCFPDSMLVGDNVKMN